MVKRSHAWCNRQRAQLPLHEREQCCPRRREPWSRRQPRRRASPKAAPSNPLPTSRCEPAQQGLSSDPLRVPSAARRFPGRFSVRKERARQRRECRAEPLAHRLGFANVDLRRGEARVPSAPLDLQRVVPAYGHPRDPVLREARQQRVVRNREVACASCPRGAPAPSKDIAA
jgi:hypothetical protein